jgi:hypothetical protein
VARPGPSSAQVGVQNTDANLGHPAADEWVDKAMAAKKTKTEKTTEPPH